MLKILFSLTFRNEDVENDNGKDEWADIVSENFLKSS